MEIKQVKETCLYVQDLDRTEQFYHEKLGLPTISKSDGRHIFFRAGTSVLLCFLPEETRRDEQLPPHWAFGRQHIALEVEADAYEPWKAKITAEGIPVTHEASWGEKYRSFYFEDPDGHVLEIVPEGMWGG